MIKKFRRSAAGVDEQLPSDLRPPSVLRVRSIIQPLLYILQWLIPYSGR